MSRNYSDTPEPRYVDRAKYADNTFTLPEDVDKPSIAITDKDGNQQNYTLSQFAKNACSISRWYGYI